MLKKAAPNMADPHVFENKRTAYRIRPSHSRIWSRANRTPPAAVMKVQRTQLALAPDLAARVASSMVRLLLTRMKVISITLRMLGKKRKGSGQSALALRT